MSDGVTTTDIWPWFAVAGILGFVLDWLLFGRSRFYRLTLGRLKMWSRA